MERYVAALSERFSCPVEPFGGYVALDVDNGQKLEIRFAETTATITTRVAGAHNGLPEPILRDLLMQAFPGNQAAGAILRQRANQDFLELANVLPYAAIDPQDFAAIASKQTDAAVALSERVQRKTAEFLATGSEGGR